MSSKRGRPNTISLVNNTKEDIITKGYWTQGFEEEEASGESTHGIIKPEGRLNPQGRHRRITNDCRHESNIMQYETAKTRLQDEAAT